jgi:hypothetical protein
MHKIKASMSKGLCVQQQHRPNVAPLRLRHQKGCAEPALNTHISLKRLKLLAASVLK